MVEINSHGGVVSVRRILQEVLRAGARLAEPGEFTKRAFLNGRIDLSQAEAVIDLIRAKTDQAAKQAVRQMEGKLSRAVKSLRQNILELLAAIEVNIDYPEYDADQVTHELVAREGKQIRERFVTYCGWHNRGKYCVKAFTRLSSAARTSESLSAECPRAGRKGDSHRHSRHDPGCH